MTSGYQDPRYLIWSLFPFHLNKAWMGGRFSSPHQRTWITYCYEFGSPVPSKPEISRLMTWLMTCESLQSSRYGYKSTWFTRQCHTRQINDNRTDLLKQTGLQILKKLQTLGSQINWSAKFKETTGETNLGSQITACIENGKSYWWDCNKNRATTRNHGDFTA